MGNRENKDFNWQLSPTAWNWIKGVVDRFVEDNPDLSIFRQELENNAGIRLIDVVDHLRVEMHGELEAKLEGFGYIREDSMYSHPEAILPGVLPCSRRMTPGLVLKVDCINQFLSVRGLNRKIEGSIRSRVRQCLVSESEGIGFWIMERRTSRVNEPIKENRRYLDIYCRTLEQWQTRPRHLPDDREAMDMIRELADRQVKIAGVDLAAFLFFEAERRYWQSRNRAAGLLKNRLDSLGLGWAVHDHHTYRSSRENFSQLVNFFIALGFSPRERFYAGGEAGWGAQVMENPAVGITLFLDVDLSPGELDIDFIEEGLPTGDGFGTVGLWCALHGDSLFASGLHHLAVRAGFDRLTQVLDGEKVGMMKPFSSLPYLRQAFTRGETWPVKEDRIEKLLSGGHISREAAERFAGEGAVGGHLENIQREDGYKGFSQEEVSAIIRDTDPQSYK